MLLSEDLVSATADCVKLYEASKEVKGDRLHIVYTAG